jgi:hypothetical protein
MMDFLNQLKEWSSVISAFLSLAVLGLITSIFKEKFSLIEERLKLSEDEKKRLKEINEDLKKIGSGLGVEGFERPQIGSQHIDVRGSNNKVAGRDLIDKLDKLQTDFAEIQQSISNDHRAIQNYFKGDGLNDYSGSRSYVVNTLYERGERIADAMQSSIQYWTSEGWKFEFFSSDYHGIFSC